MLILGRNVHYKHLPIVSKLHGKEMQERGDIHILRSILQHCCVCNSGAVIVFPVKLIPAPTQMSWCILEAIAQYATSNSLTSLCSCPLPVSVGDWSTPSSLVVLHPVGPFNAPKNQWPVAAIENGIGYGAQSITITKCSRQSALWHVDIARFEWIAGLWGSAVTSTYAFVW